MNTSCTYLISRYLFQFNCVSVGQGQQHQLVIRSNYAGGEILDKWLQFLVFLENIQSPLMISPIDRTYSSHIHFEVLQLRQLVEIPYHFAVRKQFLHDVPERVEHFRKVMFVMPGCRCVELAFETTIHNQLELALVPIFMQLRQNLRLKLLLPQNFRVFFQKFSSETEQLGHSVGNLKLSDFPFKST